MSSRHINVKYALAAEKAYADIAHRWPQADITRDCVLIVGPNACAYVYNNNVVILPYWSTLNTNVFGQGVQGAVGVIGGDTLKLYSIDKNRYVCLGEKKVEKICLNHLTKLLRL